MLSRESSRIMLCTDFVSWRRSRWLPIYEPLALHMTVNMMSEHLSTDEESAVVTHQYICPSRSSSPLKAGAHHCELIRITDVDATRLRCNAHVRRSEGQLRVRHQCSPNLCALSHLAHTQLSCVALLSDRAILRITQGDHAALQRSGSHGAVAHERSRGASIPAPPLFVLSRVDPCGAIPLRAVPAASAPQVRSELAHPEPLVPGLPALVATQAAAGVRRQRGRLAQGHLI